MRKRRIVASFKKATPEASWSWLFVDGMKSLKLVEQKVENLYSEIWALTQQQIH
jgi:hypothetical protein